MGVWCCFENLILTSHMHFRPPLPRGGPLARRQKISSRVRAPAFAGATTGVRGGRNALGAPLEALQRPHATSYHLLTTFVPLTPTSEKHYPTHAGLVGSVERRRREKILPPARRRRLFSPPQATKNFALRTSKIYVGRATGIDIEIVGLAHSKKC